MNTIDSIDLQDSFVLGWKRKGSELVFSVEFSLLPNHPAYSEPNKNEWSCYRKGRLLFSAVETVSGLMRMKDVAFTLDPDGSKDFGNIDAFKEKDGKVSLEGDFGIVSLLCSSWTIDLDSKNTEPAEDHNG